MYYVLCNCMYVFFFKQKTAYEMRISDWSSDVCSSDLRPADGCLGLSAGRLLGRSGRGLKSRPVFHLLGDEVVHQVAVHFLDCIRTKAFGLGPLAPGDRKSVV